MRITRRLEEQSNVPKLRAGSLCVRPGMHHHWVAEKDYMTEKRIAVMHMNRARWSQLSRVARLNSALAPVFVLSALVHETCILLLVL